MTSPKPITLYDAALAERGQDQGKAGSNPARSLRSGETGAGFDSPVMDSGEPKSAAGPAVNSTAESVLGAPTACGNCDQPAECAAEQRCLKASSDDPTAPAIVGRCLFVNGDPQQAPVPPEDDDLPGMLAVAEGVRGQKWPHTMDAVVWADKWIELTANKTREDFRDHSWMVSWFANAIMAGYDTATMRASAPTAPAPPESGIVGEIDSELAACKDDEWELRRKLERARDEIASIERVSSDRARQRDEILTKYHTQCERIASLEAEVARLTEQRNFQCARKLEYVQRAERAEAELARAKPVIAQYNELLYAVERKFPDETRHQTALRYIQNAEHNSTSGCDAARSTRNANDTRA